MRTTVFLAAMLAAGWAQADWVPTLASNNHVVTISYGGGSVTYKESTSTYDGRISPFVGNVKAAQYNFGTTLNNVVAAKIGQQAGVTFRAGTLTGNLHARMQPIGNDTILMSLDGIGYEARSTYTAKKLGIIRIDCVNTFSANNISITGQYGANNGVIAPSVGVNSNVNSSTDCDTDLSWILPVIGGLLVDKVTGILDNQLEDAARQAMAKVKNDLLYIPDPQWGVGLSRLIYTPDGILLSNGTSFNLGSYVVNNLPYLLGNSQIDLQLGKGLDIRTVPGTSAPPGGPAQADVLNLSITSPSVSFSVRVYEEAYVRWNWKCPANSPPGGCREP